MGTFVSFFKMLKLDKVWATYDLLKKKPKIDDFEELKGVKMENLTLVTISEIYFIKISQKV